MIYELITPTDPYTFEAPTKEIAALVIFLLSTFYAAETDDESNEYDIPVLYFLDPDEWYKDEFGHSASDGLIQNQTAVKAALLSFVYGYHLDKSRLPTSEMRGTAIRSVKRISPNTPKRLLCLRSTP